MYIPNNTTPRLALCIISTILFIASAYAQSNSTTCYNAINNGDLVTTFYVEEDTPFAAPYACQLSANNIAFDGSTYTFTVSSNLNVTSCGEMLSIPEISFGYYECEMQIPGIAGTVASCMVASSVRTDYESVYIKFFGNDTSRVYLGYYGQGVGYSFGPVVLSFDASAKPHKYAFEWTSGYIKWFVDNNEVSSATGSHPIALTPNRFYASLLTEDPGVSTDDSGIFTDNTVNRVFTPQVTPVIATFTNISYTPAIYVSCDGTGIIPGNSGYAPYDPYACDLRADYSIYSDSLAKGWSSQDSTSSNFSGNWQSGATVRTGSAAIAWTFLPTTARLYFIKDQTFSSSDYDTFEFWIYAASPYNGQQIGIQMLFDDNGAGSQVVNIADVLVGGVPSAQWSRIVVPFTLFGINSNSSQDVKGFVLSSLSTVFGGVLSIDDVILGYDNPMCQNVTQSIYAEGPASGFSAATSWGPGYNIESTQSAHSGTYSIQWTLYGNGAGGGIRIVNAKKNYPTKTYQGVSFWINTAGLQGWDWTVALTSAASTATNNVAGAGPIFLFGYYGGTLPQQVNQWSHIVIPFAEFGITSTDNLNGILFQLTTNDYQGILYIDDIDFIEEVQPGSSVDTSSASGLTAGLVGTVLLACLMLL